MTQNVYHPAASRGHADHGWLNSYHSFSFAQYHNPDRMHFGALRVLNDDTVVGGKGFGSHPHHNMEIISIPLEGDLEHQDDMGNKKVIRQGDVQVMSAGTGVIHSEYNHNQDQPVKFLQIWLFPKEQNVKPRYGQQSLDPSAMHNQLLQLVSPNPEDAGVWIHQDAWFSMGRFDLGKRFHYVPKKAGNGVYLFILEGSFQVGDQLLNRRDGYGIRGNEELTIVSKEAASTILVMDIPMLA